MLSDKLLQKDMKTVYHETTDTEDQSCKCTSLDKTFAWGLVLVWTIVGTIIYFALYYKPY